MVNLRPDRPFVCGLVWRWKHTDERTGRTIKKLERVEPALKKNATCDPFWADQEVKERGRGRVMLNGVISEYPVVKPGSKIKITR